MPAPPGADGAQAPVVGESAMMTQLLIGQTRMESSIEQLKQALPDHETRIRNLERSAARAVGWAIGSGLGAGGGIGSVVAYFVHH